VSNRPTYGEPVGASLIVCLATFWCSNDPLPGRYYPPFSCALTWRIRMNIDFATAIDTAIAAPDSIPAVKLQANHSGIAHFGLAGKTVVVPLLTPHLLREPTRTPRCVSIGHANTALT